MLTCKPQYMSHSGDMCKEGGGAASVWVTHVEVGHDGLFELVPQSAGDDVYWDVMGDHPTAAGKGGLVV